MSTKREINQGDVFMVDLSVDSIDHEQTNVRPCVIASCDIRNRKSDNIFIFPITHAVKKTQPCHYKLYKDKYDFFTYKINTVLCQKCHFIFLSHSFLKKQLVGTSLVIQC